MGGGEAEEMAAASGNGGARGGRGLRGKGNAAATAVAETGDVVVEGAPLAAASSGTQREHPPQPDGDHQLGNSWTLWFDNPSAKLRQVAWGSSIRAVHTVSSVEQFWSLLNNIRQPSKLAIGADLYYFKHNIEPKWEDPVCANGGRWAISCYRGKFDEWWLYTLLAMIGEQFDHGDEICGVVINIRTKQERLALWTKNGLDGAVQMSIGRQWKEFLNFHGDIPFILHDDAKRHDRFTRSMYIV